MSDQRPSETKYVEYWCPSCRVFMERPVAKATKVLRQFCENAGRVVTMRRKAK